jgi:hypothetical protein
LYHLKLFHGIFNWAKGNLVTEKVNKLLATENEGRMVYHVAAEFCELDVFKEILNWAK